MEQNRPSICCDNMLKRKLADYKTKRSNDGTWHVTQKEVVWCINCGCLHLSYQRNPYEGFVTDMEYPKHAQEEFKKMFLGEFTVSEEEIELRKLIKAYYEATPDTVPYVEARKKYSELKTAARLLGFDNKQFVRIRDEISRTYD